MALFYNSERPVREFLVPISDAIAVAKKGLDETDFGAAALLFECSVGVVHDFASVRQLLKSRNDSSLFLQAPPSRSPGIEGVT